MPLDLKINLDLGSLVDDSNTNICITVKTNGAPNTGPKKENLGTPNLLSSQATITPKAVYGELDSPCQDPFGENMVRT
ncbi:uncharacterized protein PGTG_09786 [Puccinia graminis f. sp. tritici CRL 75-36-700-3]|uniref:Uncharacterized protein n=1 Tax=Puccinia graminis f. sp. tritici (strain CRL 75-36-700-3 / race SCCL) TaxID=418459 RepID=E3KEU3_PUCGT|nr:uncharacterized protein PGTG_09786 [Puccinia graminis f. sp. tritici CRL 75-36-700-3]EFP82818.2 hypothetical protein PGTG_09786 [Puccinia graminis f. sp. tritici CRL 75-36-700-3]